MTAIAWLFGLAVLGLVLGLMLTRAGRAMRRRRGLGEGETVSLDRITLSSVRLGLTGRPDRLIRENGMVIPEEWKSSRKVRSSHQAQIGVYFLLIEDQMGSRPTHGFIVCGDGTRHRIENTEELRDWVLAIAGQIRATRAVIGHPIEVRPHHGQ